MTWIETAYARSVRQWGGNPIIWMKGFDDYLNDLRRKP